MKVPFYYNIGVYEVIKKMDYIIMILQNMGLKSGFTGMSNDMARTGKVLISQ